MSPIIFFTLLLSLIFALIKFTLVFIYKFIFVYLFYITIGFQAIMGKIDEESYLVGRNKAIATLVFIAFATIYTLSGGLFSWFY
jgi:hypothetical protein